MTVRVAPLSIATIAFLAAAPLAAQSGLHVSPRALSFGDRGHGERPELTLTLTNRGTETLSGLSLTASCSCIQLAPTRLRLAVGESRDVKVSMGSGRAMGHLNKRVEIQGAGTPIRVPTTMHVFDGFRQKPLEIVYSAAVGGDPVTRTVDILWSKRTPAPADLSLTVHSVLEWSAARRSRVPSEYFTWRVEEIRGGRRIHLTVDPRHPEGKINAEVRCTFRGKPLKLYLRGDVFDGIAIEPTTIGYSRVEWWKRGTSMYREILLRSTDGKPFDVGKMRVELTRSKVPGLDLVLTATPRRKRTEWILRARLEIPGVAIPEGSFSGKAHIETTHPKKKQLEIGVFGFLATPK